MALGSIALRFGQMAAKLGRSARNVFASGMASRGLQLSANAAVWGREIAQYVKNNPAMAALVAVELSRAGAIIDFDEVLEAAEDSLSQSEKQLIESQRLNQENRLNTLGDGEPGTIGGISTEEYRKAAAVHKHQTETLEQGIRAAGGQRMWQKLYASFFNVDPQVISMYFQPENGADV